jgi:hypothetical protein
MSECQTKGREHYPSDNRMEFAEIPGTALKVSRVAIGTWAIGGWMWGLLSFLRPAGMAESLEFRGQYATRLRTLSAIHCRDGILFPSLQGRRQSASTEVF